MKSLRLLFVLCVTLVPLIVVGQDTIFAKGGTCLYKIFNLYRQCMDKHNARLTRDKANLEPIYTRAALTDSVNKISCCAYWEFYSCVQDAADQHCPGERRDMEAYVRQLGSAVPIEDCAEYPRDSPECSDARVPLLNTALVLISSLLTIIHLMAP